MLTSGLVFSSFPHFGFFILFFAFLFILFFAFQLCFEVVLENSTLGGGVVLRLDIAFYRLSIWCFRVAQCSHSKSCLSSSSRDWRSCWLVLFFQRRWLNFWWKTCTMQEFMEREFQFSTQNWPWGSVMANFVARMLVKLLGRVREVGGWKTEILLSPIPYLCDIALMIVYLHPCCSLQTRLFLYSTPGGNRQIQAQVLAWPKLWCFLKVGRWRSKHTCFGPKILLLGAGWIGHSPIHSS